MDLDARDAPAMARTVGWDDGTDARRRGSSAKMSS